MQFYSYETIQYYILALAFGVFILLFFYIPGNVLSNKLKLPFLQRIIASFSLGIVLWIFQGLLFGYLQLRWLTYIYVVLFFLTWLLQKPKLDFNHTRLAVWLREQWLLLVIIIIGTIALFSSVWMMGMQTKNGLIFCCKSIPDNMYHFALTNSLVHTFPPEEPGMAGVTVHNYHYLSNLAIAEFVRISELSLLPVQGQFFPLFLSLLLGFTLLAIGQIAKLSKSTMAWFLFFLYFHGDILYLLIFLTKHQVDFNFTILDDSSKLLTAPPLYFGVTIFFASVFFLLLWLQKKSWYLAILYALLTGCLIGLKIYIALLSLAGLSVLILYYIIFERKIKELLPFIVAYLVALAIYLPVNSEAGGLFWSGFWRIENFIVQPQLGVNSDALRMQVYTLKHNYLRNFLIDLKYLFIYLFAFMGSLSVGFLQSRKSLGKIDRHFHVFLISAIFIGGILGLFTLQTIGGANTVQFIIFLLYPLSFYAALAVSYLLKKPNIIVRCFIIIFLVLTTLRPFYEALATYSLPSHRDTYVISSDTLQLLNCIRVHTVPDKYIVTNDFYLDGIDYSLPLLTDRKFYLVGNGILEDHGVTPLVEQREESAHTILSSGALATNLSVGYTLVSAHNNHASSFVPTSCQNQSATLYAIP